MLIYVTGGARSGKSAFAEDRARRLPRGGDGRIAYLATGQAVDAEFERRIAHHRQRRGADFATYEEALRPADALERAFAVQSVALLECLTTWLGNLFFHLEGQGGAAIEAAAEAEVDRLLAVAAAHPHAALVAVGNELGMGLVPPDPTSRAYRDCHGRICRRVAQAADEAWLVVSGLPLRLK